MELNNISEKNIERILKLYYKVPFFKDNPYYIDMWRKYFILNNKDPTILFFMKKQGISKNYHFLYVELSRYFKEKGLDDVSIHILKNALSSNVYKKDVLLKELSKYQDSKKVLNEEQILKELNPEALTFWGKEWDFAGKTSISKQKESMCGSFESFRNFFLSKKFSKFSKNEDRLNPKKFQSNFSSIRTHIKENQNIMKKIGAKAKELEENNNKDNNDFGDSTRETYLDLKYFKSRFEIPEINMRDCITIDDHRFYVKDKLDEAKFLLVKFTSSKEVLGDKKTSYYTLHMRIPDLCTLDKFIPEELVSFDLFTLYRGYRFGLLESIVNLQTNLQGFFIAQVLEVLIYYSSKNIFFSNLSTKDFFMDDNLRIKLCRFETTNEVNTWNHEVFDELKFFEILEYNSMRLEDAYDILSKNIENRDTKLSLLRLKCEILSRKCGVPN